MRDTAFLPGQVSCRGKKWLTSPTKDSDSEPPRQRLGNEGPLFGSP